MSASLDRAVEALRNYEQADADGVMVRVSRQALDELLAALPHLSPGVVELLSGLKRFDARIAGGCECCGTWVEYEEEKTGEVVMWRDILALIDNKQESSNV